MGFLADVWVPCEVCGGRRYQDAALCLTVGGRSLAALLAGSVDEALALFADDAAIARPLRSLAEVGLGYLRLGQPSESLSGGEAQRLRLAGQLAEGGRARGRKLYVLDEPTAGLHLQDVALLLRVLRRLVDEGHSVLVVEHHLDVLRHADWIVELGPKGGPGGGRVVAEGKPTDIATRDTATGRCLREDDQ